jgi:hypothetical protein
MLATVRLRLGAAVLGAALALATAAGAATANFAFDTYLRGELARAQADRATFLAGIEGTDRHVEGFEGFRPWGQGTGTQNLRRTAVGSFRPFGQAGGGHAVVGDGSKLQVRSDNTMRWGRYNLDGSGGLEPGNWLDSNDNRGVRWRIAGLGEFDSVGFFVSDVADVGGRFSIKVGDTVYRNIAGKAGQLRNGNIHFVRIELPAAVERLTIRLFHDRGFYRRGGDDGFGIDGVVVGRSVAPIPLPPGLLLMAPALGLLAAAGLGRGRRPA